MAHTPLRSSHLVPYILSALAAAVSSAALFGAIALTWELSRPELTQTPAPAATVRPGSGARPWQCPVCE
jgi:hypothetical protein